MTKYKGGNNANLGAIIPKTGKSYAPLCRSAGFNMAQASTVQSKTRTGHPHLNKHYKYEAASFWGDTENILGYSPE